MPLNIQFVREGDPELESAINAIIAEVNGLTDDNIVPAAGISSTKLENGALLTTHADRHAGLDPLPSNSVGTAQLGYRTVNSYHLSPGCVQAIHIAEGAISQAVFMDSTPMTYNHGDVPEAPPGYEDGTVACLIVGIHLPANSGDRGCRGPIDIYCVIGESVQCQMYEEDNSQAFQGSLDVIRIAFK